MLKRRSAAGARWFRYLCLVTAAFSLLAGAAAAQAQDYPNRPVKIIVPFPAGGTADAVPRLVAEWLSRKWGQPVVIENPTGAAGNIGSESPIARSRTATRCFLRRRRRS